MRAGSAPGDMRDEGVSVGAVRAWLLGGFRVAVGERSIGEGEWGLKKAKSLIKLLALNPEHRLHRERAMDVLWPDLAPAAAANNLHRTLHAARKALDPAHGSTCLTLRGEHIALCPGGELRVDVAEFEAAAKMARKDRSLSAYRRATELYTGDLLPENLYDDWAEGRRERLRVVYLDLLVELAARYEEHGKFDLAAETLEKIPDAGPRDTEVGASLVRLRELTGQGRSGRSSGVSSAKVRGGVQSGRDTLHNLPAPLASFVGREREVAEIRKTLAASRLLTLTGAGGSGKTRLALEAARDLVSLYPDGIWLVEFAPLLEGTPVRQAVCRALDVRERPDRSLSEVLLDALRSRELLLVLDNCEHLVNDVATLAERMLVLCPGVSILATSRETLGVPGEIRYPVPPLSLPVPKRSLERPPAVEELERSESALLFVERASYRGADFALTRRNAGTVAQICHRLAGLPLAIELAAARVGTLSVEQISDRLDDSLTLLTGGSRTATPRQQTLRGALDWGHELLDLPEKRLFGRLSSFAGGWTLEAVEAVGAGNGIEKRSVPGLLFRLAEKSLITVDAGSEPRYGMLEPIRQYARERLEENGETGSVLDRHATFFLALAEEAEPELRGLDQALWMTRLDTEYDNLQAALGWTLERGGSPQTGLGLAGALGEFWMMRGRMAEGRRWLEAALKNGGAVVARSKGLFWAASVAREQGDYGRAESLGEENLGLVRGFGNRTTLAAVLYDLGLLSLYQNSWEQARLRLEEALALQREAENSTGMSLTLQALGSAALVRGDYRRAAGLNGEAMALARDTGDAIAGIFAFGMGALVAVERGDPARAEKLYTEGFALARQFGHERLVIHYLHISAVLAGAGGRFFRAAKLWGATEVLRENIGAVLSPVEASYYGPYIRAVREALDEQTCKAAWAEGRTMSRSEATDYVLSEEKRPGEKVRAKALQPLSPRELEVAHLISEDLTNRRIAETLGITRRTADTHVAAILRKLGFSSRRQVALWIKDQPRKENNQS